MAINYPNNPNLNDTHVVGDVTWTWNGTAWEIGTSGGGAGSSAYTDASVNAHLNTNTASTDQLLSWSGSDYAWTDAGAGGSGDTNQNAFSTIVTDTGANVVADTTTDSFTLAGGTNLESVGNADNDSVTINLQSFSIDFLSDVDTTTSAPATGNVLKWDGAKWAPGADATTGGAGTDADTLDGFDSAYFLNYTNFTNTPSVLTLTGLSVGPANTASGTGAISYDNTTGIFKYTPPDLSTYLTSVAFADLTGKPTTISGYGITDALVLGTTSTTALAGDTTIPADVSDLTDTTNLLTGASYTDASVDTHLNTGTASNNEVLSWTGTDYAWVSNAGGGGGDANQNAFSTIAIGGEDSVVADTPTDTFNLIAGTGISLSTNASTDSITITAASSVAFGDLTDAPSGLTPANFYESAITTFRVTNTGSSSYEFDSHYSGSNPTIFVLSGTTVAFDLTAIGGHPFAIQDSTGTNYNTGLVHIDTDGTITTGSNAQGKSSGTLYWRIQESLGSPPNYRYQCTSHVSMVGAITIKRISSI